MDLQILTSDLLDSYTKAVKKSPLDKIDRLKKVDMPVDYFEFYKSISSVYSSKIEGEYIDFDSYFKHKFLKVELKPDYTQKADDLYSAYDFIDHHELTRLASDCKDGHVTSASLMKFEFHEFLVLHNRDATHHREALYYYSNKTVIFRFLKDNCNDPNNYLHQLWCCRTQESSINEAEILFRERVSESNEKVLEKESVREKQILSQEAS